MGLGEDFRSAYGKGQQYRAFSKADRSRLEATLPDYLLDQLGEDGWAGYRDGLLWTVDPAEYAPVVARWNVPEESALHAVARTSFGTLYVLGNFKTRRGTMAPAILGIDPHVGEYSFVGPSAKLFLTESLAQDRYIKDALREPETKRAVKDVGPLGSDEMYGYEPALPLGGSGKPETVRRLNLFAHHALLSQLAPIKLRKF